MENRIFVERFKVEFRADRWDYNFDGRGVECKYAMRKGYSDVDPYEILEVKGNKVLIRAMDCKQVGKLVQHAGGFAAHTENSTQEWEITPDPEAPKFWISLRKNGHFYRVGDTQNGTRYNLRNEPYKYYDFNF